MKLVLVMSLVAVAATGYKHHKRKGGTRLTYAVTTSDPHQP